MQSDISGYDGYSETFDVNNYWKSSDEGVYTVRAEVFGNGIDMWLRSQGDYIKVIT